MGLIGLNMPKSVTVGSQTPTSPLVGRAQFCAHPCIEALLSVVSLPDSRQRKPKQLEAPAVVPDIKPVRDKTHTQGHNAVAAAEAVDQAGNEGKPDPAGDARTGRGTEPGKLPVEPGCAAPTAPEPLRAGAAEDGVALGLYTNSHSTSVYCWLSRGVTGPSPRGQCRLPWCRGR